MNPHSNIPFLLHPIYLSSLDCRVSEMPISELFEFVFEHISIFSLDELAMIDDSAFHHPLSPTPPPHTINLRRLKRRKLKSFIRPSEQRRFRPAIMIFSLWDFCLHLCDVNGRFPTFA